MINTDAAMVVFLLRFAHWIAPAHYLNSAHQAALGGTHPRQREPPSLEA